MCPNCSDVRLNPCLCHKHDAERRERDARGRKFREEESYWLREHERCVRFGDEIGALEAEERLANNLREQYP